MADHRLLDLHNHNTTLYVSFKTGHPVLNDRDYASILFLLWVFVDLAKDTQYGLCILISGLLYFNVN